MTIDDVGTAMEAVASGRDSRDARRAPEQGRAPRSLSGSAGLDEQLPSYIRAVGDVGMAFQVAGRRTSLVERAEGGGFLVRTPRDDRSGTRCEAILINTGGGMAGGDQLALRAQVRAGAAAVITTLTAEKIYRSQGPLTTIRVSLDLAAGTRLAWLPQETILFSGSRMRRELAVTMTTDAIVTITEIAVFGRTAMGEEFASGIFEDRWRVRRGGKLAFAEDIVLADEPARRLARRACGAGARAVATILHIAPNAEARLEEARAMLEIGSCECGASAWNGMLLMRFVADDAGKLRSHVVQAVEWLRGEAMPRCW